MQVKEIMTPNVVCIGPDATLKDAAIKMRDLDVGALPVCENDRLAGMITDRDIAVRGVARGSNPDTTLVREVMTREAISCNADEDVAEAARHMKDKQIRRLLVLNPSHRLVGILSLGDLAVETGDEIIAGNTLEAISEPMLIAD